MESRVKFHGPQNFPGALQQNSVAAFSQSAEGDGETIYKNETKWLPMLRRLNPSVQRPQDPNLISKRQYLCTYNHFGWGVVLA